MALCIICENINDANSIEHIVPESLGNKFYIMKKGFLCDDCNNRFSKFEQKALGQTILAFERARHGVPSKKSKTAKGAINGIQFEGDRSFQKDFLLIKNFQDNLSNFNPADRTYKLSLLSINTQYVSVSKLLLKTGIEAIFTSRYRVYCQNNFDELKDYLTATPKNLKDWPFVTTSIELDDFNWIPEKKFHYN